MVDDDQKHVQLRSAWPRGHRDNLWLTSGGAWKQDVHS